MAGEIDEAKPKSLLERLAAPAEIDSASRSRASSKRMWARGWCA